MNNTTLLFLFSSVMSRPVLAMLVTNFKCRNGTYPRSNVERFPVPDDKVSWDKEYESYAPIEYTSSAIYGKPWADLKIDDASFKPKWNSIDGNVNRKSHMGDYSIREGYPINPVGRTGIKGRGTLGRWGPNHAADPIVTKWKILQNGEKVINSTTLKPVLQFVAIKRGDTGEWALPGGMVDPGEKVANTAVREFQEEAINSLTMTEDEKAAWKEKFHHFFSEGTEVYSGYVDDHRNTDNSWMETVAYNFHDELGTIVGSLRLSAGDDAIGVRWIDYSSDLKLSANHKDIVNLVAEKLDAHR